MKWHLCHNERTSQYEAYKIFLSILFGLAGFFASFASILFDYGDVNIIINWGLIFPLLVSLAWGKKYGCISILFGLTILYPFFLGKYNGWAALVPAFSIFVWISYMDQEPRLLNETSDEYEKISGTAPKLLFSKDENDKY